MQFQQPGFLLIFPFVSRHHRLPFTTKMPRYTPPYPYHSFSTPIDSPAFGSGYEELCPISGLRPCGGPTMLFWDLQECFDMVMKSLEE